MKTLDKKVMSASMDHNVIELALGWLRYKAVRMLSPRKYVEMDDHCKEQGVRFDDMIDKLITDGCEECGSAVGYRIGNTGELICVKCGRYKSAEGK